MNGLIWYSTRKATVGLVVCDGWVVARQLLGRALADRNVDVRWLPDSPQ